MDIFQLKLIVVFSLNFPTRVKITFIIFKNLTHYERPKVQRINFRQLCAQCLGIEKVLVQVLFATSRMTLLSLDIIFWNFNIWQTFHLPQVKWYLISRITNKVYNEFNELSNDLRLGTLRNYETLGKD